MYNIIEHIEYLMMSHDCVVIPGWGALVAQYSESFYNPQAGHIEKPQRKLGFNASVNHNDGLLAQSLVRREGLSYSDALKFIAQSVSSFRQQLSQGNEVSLGRLGFFHSDSDGHIEFIPFYHETCNDNYFGLRSVKFRPLLEMAQEQANQAETSTTRPMTSRRLSMPRHYAQIAASIVALVCLTVLLTTPIIVNHDQQQLASLDLPKISGPHRQVIDWNHAKIDLAIGLPAEAVLDQQQAQEQAKIKAQHEAEQNLLLNEGGKYYLVISSLTSAQQVAAFKQSHPDLAAQMQVMKSRGKLYRIYVARSYDPAHLLKIRDQLPENYSDAWICH